jgi:preprotein translocase subunit SecG
MLKKDSMSSEGEALQMNNTFLSSTLRGFFAKPVFWVFVVFVLLVVFLVYLGSPHNNSQTDAELKAQILRSLKASSDMPPATVAEKTEILKSLKKSGGGAASVSAEEKARILGSLRIAQ